MKKILSLVMLASLVLSLLPAAALAAPLPQAEGQSYVIQKDDWLSKLAEKYLGNVNAWPAIVLATNQKAETDNSFAKIENPDVIEPGWKVWIPSATEAEALLATGKEFIFGVVMVGPYNDHGWSEAHYTAAKYVEAKLPGAKMIYIDKLNSADRPGTTVPQVVDDFVSKGAKAILTTSDDFKDGTLEAAKAHPELPIVNVSGDHAWKEGKDFKAPANESNFMGRMEYGKMIAGCAAAMTTQTGKLGYLGPLINDETRRLASSVYLGARYCWTNYLNKNPDDLKFKVTWIGFWFNIPGVTSDPTQVANEFFNGGYDVVISGIDTTEALVVAGQQAKAGKKVWAIPYDFENACAEVPDICLGVPYFNWGPAYLKFIKSVQDGTYEQYWDWNGPDWNNINDPDTSAVGFQAGPALGAETKAKVDEFTKGLGDGSIVLWKGPLKLQDGTEYLKDGEVATDLQVWYLPQLLEGMEGQSVSK
jgi:simple sugar transport system substrate-binding protein